MDLFDPSHASSVVEANLHYLQQARELLDGMSDAVYAHANPPLYTSGVGGHLRHCLDHYESLLRGMDSGEVDYDARDRDDRLETEVGYSLDCLGSLMARLAALDEAAVARPLRARMDCGVEGAGAYTDSSVWRELQFLVSHTVHHYALIAMILRDQGLAPPASFGVAPSTLRHREKLAACAQ